MKVAIFETEHFEGAFPVIKLFDLPENEITIYTSRPTYERFKHLFGNEMNRFEWQVLPEGKRLSFFLSFYRRLKRNKPDILYLNTVSNNHLLFSLVLNILKLPRVVLTVHDINCLFESSPGNGFRARIIHKGKRSLIKAIHIFNVVSETLVEYLETKTSSEVSVIPGAVYEERVSANSSLDTIRLAVPGSLDKRRRNYEEVFELARLANQASLNLEIILLGGYTDDYGKSVVDRAKAFKSESCIIRYYETDVVHQAEFDKQLDECHFVFIPSVINTRICGDIPEIYGRTKSSGNIFDVIKHAKPFIVPEQLLVPQTLVSSCIKYKETEEIVNFLRFVKSSPGEYSRLAEMAKSNSENYTMENVRERNQFIFNNKVKP